LLKTDLGYCYYAGTGVTQSYIKALEYFSKSAGQGNCDGLYHLGICYYEGQGVDQDLNSAIKYFIASAEKGSKYAIFKLENMIDKVRI